MITNQRNAAAEIQRETREEEKREDNRETTERESFVRRYTDGSVDGDAFLDFGGYRFRVTPGEPIKGEQDWLRTLLAECLVKIVKDEEGHRPWRPTVTITSSGSSITPTDEEDARSEDIAGRERYTVDGILSSNDGSTLYELMILAYRAGVDEWKPVVSGDDREEISRAMGIETGGRVHDPEVETKEEWGRIIRSREPIEARIERLERAVYCPRPTAEDGAMSRVLRLERDVDAKRAKCDRDIESLSVRIADLAERIDTLEDATVANASRVWLKPSWWTK